MKLPLIFISPIISNFDEEVIGIVPMPTLPLSIIDKLAVEYLIMTIPDPPFPPVPEEFGLVALPPPPPPPPVLDVPLVGISLYVPPFPPP